MLIVETPGGLDLANAGIDASNVPGEERVALLPEDSDASAGDCARSCATRRAPRPRW